MLLAADPVAWAAARKVAWEQLTRSPQLAGGVLSLYTQSRGQAPVRYVTIADGVVVAVLPHHDWIQEGTHVGAPGRAATTRAAQAAAALALLADLMPPLADEDQVTAPGRNPLIEFNEGARSARSPIWASPSSAVRGRRHDPVFTCSADLPPRRRRDLAGRGRGAPSQQARAAAAQALLAELAGPAEPGSAAATFRQSPATPPAQAGVADRLIQAGCAIAYARGRVPPGASRRLAAAGGTAGSPGAGRAPAVGAGTRPECRTPTRASAPGRAWPRPSRLAAVTRRDVYPAVDAAGCDRWALVLPDDVLAGEDRG